LIGEAAYGLHDIRDLADDLQYFRASSVA